MTNGSGVSEEFSRTCYSISTAQQSNYAKQKGLVSLLLSFFETRFHYVSLAGLSLCKLDESRVDRDLPASTSSAFQMQELKA